MLEKVDLEDPPHDAGESAADHEGNNLVKTDVDPKRQFERSFSRMALRAAIAEIHYHPSGAGCSPAH